MEPEAEDVFRVRVSLERFFSDSRARCYMGAARARPVRWLARRLRRAFLLPRALALVCRGHLLPPAEPLALLRPDDLVEVIPIHPSEQVQKSKKKVPTENSHILYENIASSHHIEDNHVDEKDGPALELNWNHETLDMSVCSVYRKGSVEPGATCETNQASLEQRLAANTTTMGMDVTAVWEPRLQSSGQSDFSPADGQLEASKQRALRLLHQVAGESREPRRRRVRRRRRAPAVVGADTEPEVGPAEDPSSEPAPSPGPAPEPPAGKAGTGVVRAQSESRAPRVVRALPTLSAVSYKTELLTQGSGQYTA